MSKEEASPGGLLSKVVRFVRNPTVNWGDLDSIDADRESQYSKQMLKEMIERKRRNDFVRRREFDQLRKLRQRDALAGQRIEDSAARPSLFQSSLTSPGERAVTIQKIDEIEAQMSMQWWKGKPVGRAPSPPDTPSAGLTAPGADCAAAGEGAAFAPTAPASMPLHLEPQAAAAPLFADDSMCLSGFGAVSAPQPADGTPGAQASPSLELEVFVHEPDLEEAAIRFANGDHAGAEAGLREVLAQHAGDDAAQQFEIWMALFDLYRATGQQDSFDSLALDFAARFDRSAPLWFSIPEQLGLGAAPPGAVAARRDVSWNAPSVLTLQSVAALQAALLRAASPWCLDWSRLVDIDEAALPALANEFLRWAEQDVHIALTGAPALEALLQAHTQSGDRRANPEWWRLRMAALRCMGRPDEFELVALDYCVTYEVSPPSWSAPRCACSAASDGGGAGVSLDDPAHDLLAPHPGEGADGPLAAAPDGVPGLRGHIEGDASAALAALDAQDRPGEPLVVPCECLIRIDFSAAGSVLNWAAQQQAQGRVVQFRNLHRLVAVLFNVIGVSEHARIVPRKN
ncbi:hypothetical protein B2J88_21765 [Rhodococcus sp. SRB_17]|nr:hypothetical protein [Rhodococcus sp. SRB_17]